MSKLEIRKSKHSVSWKRYGGGTFGLTLQHASDGHTSMEFSAYEYDHQTDRNRQVMASLALEDCDKLRKFLNERFAAISAAKQQQKGSK